MDQLPRRGSEGRRVRWLQPRPTGPALPQPNAALIGVEASLLKDKDGKAFALEILQVAQPGTFAEVTYSWPRLLSNDPMRETSYVTRIEDHVCGVGYYN